MIAICPEFSKNSTFPVKSFPISHRSVTFIPSDEFERLTPEMLADQTSGPLFHSPKSENPSGREEESRDGLLLTAAGERHYFRRYNFFKSLVAGVQTKCLEIDTPRCDRGDAGEIDGWLRLADAARTVLVEANVRLVASLARKFSRSGIDFEELVSDGNLILINAIDKFDYSRGFRFSTYATHAIQRHFFRILKRKQRRNLRELLTPPEVLAECQADKVTESPVDPRLAHWLINRFDDCLTSRERLILTSRFGLQGKPEATLKAIADQIGLSKERVRQLQLRAIEKLREHLRKSKFNSLNIAEI
ncbi:MAG TPA: sigma-70 family RNA polymerase sigma factor [Planctomicrobium sp.]|nr:sigma-70 family RNA polymerase sigma factor [Planctomicrobium sp.]